MGGASESLKVISKRTGIYGAILGGVIAGAHMLHSGFNWSDTSSIGLAFVAGFIAVQPETIAIQVTSIIVDGIIMGKMYMIFHILKNNLKIKKMEIIHTKVLNGNNSNKSGIIAIIIGITGVF